MEVHYNPGYDYPDRIDPGTLANPDEEFEEPRMTKVEGLIPESIYTALQARTTADKETVDHILSLALAQYLNQPLHTLFSVSTSAAIVEGLYQGALRISHLLEHGDFGIGTFINADGEMVVLDGIAYQIAAGSAVRIAPPDTLIPYAVVTRFKEEVSNKVASFSSFNEATGLCDAMRASENLFYAFRIDGQFDTVSARVLRPVEHGTRLAAAAQGQEEHTFQRVAGTIVGLWTPGYAGSLSIPGYHFHFISDDRTRGGHVLDCAASHVSIRACSIADFHVALPETLEFLRADLSRDPNADLAVAERMHPK
ncbi:MAG TPA: acetolactate decarboxylase [Terracidiphilus sp.]|jgi:acetolactate decarboxylase